MTETVCKIAMKSLYVLTSDVWISDTTFFQHCTKRQDSSFTPTMSCIMHAVLWSIILEAQQYKKVFPQCCTACCSEKYLYFSQLLLIIGPLLHNGTITKTKPMLQLSVLTENIWKQLSDWQYYSFSMEGAMKRSFPDFSM